jgi:hypothetical protein
VDDERKESVMNKMSKKNSASEKSGGLSFKRETVRSLSADEVRQAAGGMTCLGSCKDGTCKFSVCTISLSDD